MKSKIILFVLLSLSVFIISCTNGNYKQNSSEKQKTDTIFAKTSPTIGDIVSNPKLYEGKTLTMEAKYAGWMGSELNCDKSKIALVTKSDILVFDDTGCIYVKPGVDVLSEGKILSPTDKESYGAKVKFTAKIVIEKEKPIFDK